MNKFVVPSFIFIIILIIATSFISIFKVTELYDLTFKLYKHPFKVVSSAKSVQSKLILMHKYMEDITLLQNKQKVSNTIEIVENLESEIYAEYKIIFNNYLGDKADIQKSYDAFNHTKELRHQIILFINDNNTIAADELIHSTAKQKVEYLDKQVGVLVNYAQNKAKYFLETSISKRDSTISLIYTLLFTILFVITSILFFIVKKISKFENEAIKSFNHTTTVLNTSSSAIIAIDSELNILTFNKSAEKIFGYTFQEIKHENNLNLIIPDNYIGLHNKALKSFIDTEHSTGIIDSIVEVEAKRKDGTIFPVKIAISYTGSGKNIIIVANITDISYEKKQEDHILKQSRLAQMGEMISMIAHQWRQPLGAISAVAINVQMKIDLGVIELKDDDKEFMNSNFNKINKYVQNLTTTIDDFRNFYKPNKKAINCQLENVVKKALSIVESSIINDNIYLIEDYQYLDDVQIFENEMIQVILNILKNAQDNFKEMYIENPTIKITTKDKVLSISDNGGGIPAHVIDKIFDPYFSTKEDKNGTGLGLYMSKTIVESHHDAKISVENKDGWACFRITFN